MTYFTVRKKDVIDYSENGVYKLSVLKEMSINTKTNVFIESIGLVQNGILKTLDEIREGKLKKVVQGWSGWQ